MIDSQEPERGVKGRVADWLSGEGYPLEFSTATIFHKHGFRTHQGYYVKDNQSGSLREIDVIAQATRSLDSAFVRVEYVVECKWAGDKPWVVFTSETHTIAPTACIAQTIGSEAGQALLWCLAHDKTLQSLDAFHTPKQAGFNGRQAFSKGNDVFYNALQSVASAAISLKRDLDRGEKHPERAVRFAVIILPLIVVEGMLFEASFDSESGQIVLAERDRIRVHWRGAESSIFPFTTVDLVTANSLDEFVSHRAEEAKTLLSSLTAALKQLQDSVKTKSLQPLKILPAARGISGLPPLLAAIQKMGEDNQSDDMDTA